MKLNLQASGPFHRPSLVAPRKGGGGLLVLVLLLPGLWGCDDDPFQIRWELNPDTVLLYSLARPELNLNSAFNFSRRTALRVEAPSSVDEWDLAIDTQSGAIVFLPPGAVGISESTAAIAPMPGIDFDEIRRAPRDTTLYIKDKPVPAEVGQLYVIRTRQRIGGFGTRCVYYGKVEPLSVDPLAGTIRFVYDVSPVCNDRKLVPPKD